MRIETSYNERGLVAKITCYDDADVGEGNIVNEVAMTYNDFGLLTKDAQSHAGAVNGSTPAVEYAYADGTDNHTRPTSCTYPDGRVITYDYGAADGMDDILSRLAALKESTDTRAAYTYLGMGAVVQVDYPEPDVRYDLITGTGDDPYDGLDRFDRVIDCLWYDYGASSDAARLKYGYDRVDNRIYREDAVDTTDTQDQLYAYDGIYRLTEFDRGELNSNKDGLDSLAFAQEWSLDATGNWTGFKQDDDGDTTWDLEQTRTSNVVNEITGVDETTGASWATAAYDAAGNMTTVPQPANPTATFTCVYDAWNRLVSIVDTSSSDTVAEYAYDGMKRRTLAKAYVSGSLDHTRHYYYSDDWQILEERIDSSTDPDRQFLWGQRYTDDLILRDRDTDANGSLDERLYSLQDDNWNVVAISDPSGDIQERYSYDSYGLVNFLTPAFASRASSDFDWETLYAGYRFDVATELYQVRNRYLHSLLGCWLIRDPRGYDATEFNLHRYAQNNPLNVIDAFGLEVFIAVRDLDQSAVYNHVYLVVLPNVQEDFTNLVDLYTHKKGFVVGGHNVKGQLKGVYNQKADLASVREAFDPKKYKDSSTKYKTGWSVELKRLVPPEGKTDSEFISEILDLVKTYNANISKTPVPYKLRTQNCFTLMNSLLRELGYSAETRATLLDFKGGDVGDERELPPKLFK